MDEPCSALDPIASMKVEELIDDLKRHYTIVTVTHNLQQAEPLLGSDGVLLSGQAGRIQRDDADIHQPGAQADGDYISRGGLGERGPAGLAGAGEKTVKGSMLLRTGMKLHLDEEIRRIRRTS